MEENLDLLDMIDIRLKSLQITAILFIFGNLTGCQTAEPEKVIPIKNEEKDKYIEKVESIISDSASALVAIIGKLPEGDVRQLTEAQVTRLSGVSKPSVDKVGEYSRMLNQSDSKAIQKDKDEAAKVDAETTALYNMVMDKENEIDELRIQNSIEVEKNKRALKEKILWSLSCLGMAISTAGLLIIALAPATWKVRGIILILGGSMAVASVWVLDSEWFKYILIAVSVLLLLDLILLLIRWQLGKRNKALVEPQS